jgi:CDP-diacylglycerol---glycerol-3-phosphate 3-phosphatidyltransferase
MSNCDTWAGLALPLCAAGLLLFAARPGAQPNHARVNREGGTVFLSERVMQRGYVWIDWLAAGAVRLGLGADTVSWLSLALGLVAGILAAQGWLGSAAWALALSGLGDGVDGAIARRQGTATKAGAVLDSALDRYVEFFFCGGLLYFFRDAPGRQLLVMLALCGGFMVTYSTAKAEALQIAPPRGWMKRPERIVWLVGGAALAAAAPLAGLSPTLVMLGVVAIIAVFAHASALWRLRALSAGADARRD